MSDESAIQHDRQFVFNIRVQVVFVAKYRRRVFDAQAIDVLCDIFADVCSGADATLAEMDGEDDHVHLHAKFSPKVAVSSRVNSLKDVSSRSLRQLRPDIRKRYWKGVLWSPSYFASSCGGAPINVVRQYIEQQKTPD